MSQNSALNDPSVNDRDELLRRIRELEERCRQTEDAIHPGGEPRAFDRILGKRPGTAALNVDRARVQLFQKMKFQEDFNRIGCALRVEGEICLGERRTVG